MDGERKNSWAVLDEGDAVVSLADIMNEEMALMSAFKEDQSIAEEPPLDDRASSPPVVDDECRDDHIIAKLLQSEFDRELDAMIKLQEENYNKKDKVCLSFAKYRKSNEDEASDSCNDVDDDYLEYQNNKLDHYEKHEFGRSGVICKQGVYITKHDKTLCGRKNVNKVLEFPPEFCTGDAAKLDLKLSNDVYNKLKQHSISVTKRLHRMHEKKEKATVETTMDSKTRMALYKLVNSGYLKELSGVIATGKEAAVYFSTMTTKEKSDSPVSVMEQPVAIKIYKTTLMEFRNRRHYVKHDFRFKNARKVMRIWTEREYLNMKRMYRAGVPVPKPYKAVAHMLIMQFIGNAEGEAAPKLKDVVHLDADQWADVYCQTKQAMMKMYTVCGLVHADMSEFNLLYWDDKVWVIDLAQAVDISNPDCLPFLARDCENVCRFFAEKGVETESARDVFNAISGENCMSDETFESDVKMLKTSSKRSVTERRRPAELLLGDNATETGNSVHDDDFTDSD